MHSIAKALACELRTQSTATGADSTTIEEAMLSAAGQNRDILPRIQDPEQPAPYENRNSERYDNQSVIGPITVLIRPGPPSNTARCALDFGGYVAPLRHERGAERQRGPSEGRHSHLTPSHQLR